MDSLKQYHRAFKTHFHDLQLHYSTMKMKCISSEQLFATSDTLKCCRVF